ncbi:uracil phosphoribosyltransferase [Candidatus Marifrigoribacter sp. Uisw_064]|jgi:uracil phosphoribosyltransferase|uniref:uracil phosphoribosyltransferase n=1 Tax=Candidatus Marifrigoribacter sp. Uisw_064 TaxID=3230970 RepID=UPI003D4733A8
MIVHDFDESNSIIHQFIAELRDENIQKDAMRFRKNIERIGEILSYELSKTLCYKNIEIHTPLGTKSCPQIQDNLVLCSILRAGLPLHQGVLNYFDTAENGFISAFRKHTNDQDDFEVIVNYLAAPSIQDKTLVLIDPMLATGKTLENTYKALEKYGIPKQIHIVSVIGSKTGVEYVKEIFPENTHLWIVAIDDTLNNRGYIIPGLGDAGDLSYGQKL